MAEPREIIIKGATLVESNLERRADVHVVGEHIANVAVDLEVPSRVLVLDGSGCYLMPAFVDLHTHLREPGGERAETVTSGSRAAALGGYRCVVAMPNTIPAIDSAAMVEYLRALCIDTLCEVGISAAITVGRLGERLVPIREIAEHGVRIFTDDGRGVQDDELMAEALRVGRELGVVIAQHCENEVHAHGGQMHEGRWSSALGIPGQPSSAEEVMVARDLALVRDLDASMHFLHLSTEGAIELVRRAKADGLLITAEATPHHLSLTHAEVATFDARFKVNPPLRTARDVLAVRAGVADHTIDAIATDHAPHSPETKDEPFECAPPGMIGLETAFSVAYGELVARANLRVPGDLESPTIKIADLVALFSTNPARIAGVASAGPPLIATGNRADLVVFDPSERWNVRLEDIASRSQNTPFAHLDLTGRVRHTLYRGEPVVIDATAQR
ncbi:MAG TPA: dihydroorotase [Acidimicrobiales bacterium]|nr:dihydroorotase [Acidimicrobiales bacterium]